MSLANGSGLPECDKYAYMYSPRRETEYTDASMPMIGGELDELVVCLHFVKSI